VRRVGLVLILLVLAGCGGSQTLEASKAFCLAADRYDSLLERQQGAGEVDVDRQIVRVEDIAQTAPAAIADDAQMFLDALRDVGDDPSLKDDPKVREAVDNVNRYANQACGVYDRRSGI
jgi:hypothetical protein